MAISNEVITNRLDKKINYGVARTAFDSVKDPGAETIGSPLPIPGNTIMIDADLIPAVMPTTNTADVKIHKFNSGKTVGNGVGEVGGIYELTLDTGVTSNRTWLTCSTVNNVSTIEKQWIPFGIYGSTYFALFGIGNQGYHGQNINPTTIPNFSTINYDLNNYEFYFDTDAGVFSFAGTSGLPTGFNPSTMSVYMVSGARYQGRKGVKNYINLGDLSSTSDGQALIWDDTNNEWISGTVATSGSDLTVVDETTTLSTAATKLVFKGAGVTATEPTNDQIEVTIPGLTAQGAITLTDLSIGAEGSPTDDGQISYNNSTGVFSYAPPAAFTGATSGSAGTAGFVPAPGSNVTDKYLKSDGSFSAVHEAETANYVDGGNF